MSAPASAKAGDKINVAIAFPPIGTATQLETRLKFDANYLRLVSIQEADAARNSAGGLHFSGEADGFDAVRLELNAGRGEVLPAPGGPLATLQFEVLAKAGTTSMELAETVLQSADAGKVNLPSLPAHELEVKAAP